MILAQFKLWMPSVYLMSHELRKGKKVNNNQSYFTSVARNTLPLTNKPEAEGGSDTPLSIKAPFYGYLKLRKATRKGKKSKQGFEVTPENIYIYICIWPRNQANLYPCSSKKWLRHIARVFELSYISIASENSQHFATSLLFSPGNDVWETRAEIPYWWRVTTRIWTIWVLLLIRRSKFSANQKHYPDRGSNESPVWNFCARFSDVISRGMVSAVFSSYLNIFSKITLQITVLQRVRTQSKRLTLTSLWQNPVTS